MDGWAFAALALGVVLCFEFVLFRYFAPDRSAPAGVDGAGEQPESGASNVTGGPVSGRGAYTECDRGADSAPTPGHTVVCGHCGAANTDAPAVVFCRSCLGRLG
ncbi:hypothetical protein I7X12_11330 [Halosimplex litoreum]|uniref:DUF7577 domain-containing protein n=1 Tax=Halosimplex litoreum TaxID=1198301 RepID=A0A7T3FVB9_9EURY|nr:hypothetical protein [Halosimplex litoreum]QPV61361.1 hypothetical protein I7X12_11330 [Halosimplex litoreum]